MTVKKRPLSEVIEEKFYKFMVLLPNGSSVSVTFRYPKNEMPLDEFIYVVKQRYILTMKETESLQKSRIRWNSGDVWFQDAFDNITSCESKRSGLLLWCQICYDGSGAVVDTYEDNSLHSVWVNGVNEKKLISQPFFGMFGNGGSIVSMHLGRRALVSSKRKESKKDALLCSFGSTWGPKVASRIP